MKDYRGIFGEYTGLCGKWTSVIFTSDCQADLTRQEEMGSVSMSDGKGTLRRGHPMSSLGRLQGAELPLIHLLSTPGHPRAPGLSGGAVEAP